ncbi:hypothetical protein BOX15_Mlig026583g1 [Macrostomum lignano]|uniref:Uncharacterized protein n=1 Tax=Macrostomum lignano TaxID=282301 RepID=A0A267ELE7_9PLAT|nr:hypothetical protein BOX15_Mlig026583g1 [Macrostomum lignano]
MSIRVALLFIVILTFSRRVTSEDRRQQISRDLQQICDALTSTASNTSALADLVKKELKSWRDVETCSADGVVISVKMSDGFQQCWNSVNLEAYAQCLERSSFFCDITTKPTLKQKCDIHPLALLAIVGGSIAVSAVLFSVKAYIRRRRMRQMTVNHVRLL